MDNQTTDNLTQLRKASLISLGCARNKVDSEVMLGKLLSDGWAYEPDPENADVIIVNTCGFIQSAKEESIDTILEMAEFKKQNPNLKLVVAGCLTQRYRGQLQEALPEVDLFVGTDQFVHLPELLEKKLSGEVHTQRENYLYNHNLPRVNTLAKHAAYVKVAEGCEHNCSFCIIPAIRGKLRSRPIESIVAEVENLAADGVLEINLIAQDLAAFGRDRCQDELLPMLKALVKIEGIRWIRMLYMYPEHITDEFIEFFANEPKLVKYLDIPVQHASNRLLKLMNRGVTQEEVAENIGKLRASIPDIAIRTSVMVGFPSETEEDFQELLKFVQEQKFDHLGCFTYSKEEGTVAGRMKEQLEEDIKEERQALIMESQRVISKQTLQDKVGQTLDVLIEGPSHENPNMLQGRLAYQAPEVDGQVFVEKEDQLTAHEIHQLRIVHSLVYDLVGEPVKPS